MKPQFFARTLGICGASLLLAETLIAQPDNSSGTTYRYGPGSSQTSPQSPSAYSAPSPTSRMGPERATRLMNANVKDLQGNSVGQISDFIINPASGRIQFAVISLSDQSGKLTAVPWGLIRPGSDPNTCTLNVSKQKLEGSQTFDSNSWPDFSQPSTSQQIYSYFGVQPGRYRNYERNPSGENPNYPGTPPQP